MNPKEEIKTVHSQVVSAMRHNIDPYRNCHAVYKRFILLASMPDSDYQLWVCDNSITWMRVNHHNKPTDFESCPNSIYRITNKGEKPPKGVDREQPIHDPDYEILVPSIPVKLVSYHDRVAAKAEYKVKVYVRHGYFEYTVNDMEQALAHGEVIMSGGTYRRSTTAGDVEIHKVLKVKICGPGLKSEYLDTFKRT